MDGFGRQVAFKPLTPKEHPEVTRREKKAGHVRASKEFPECRFLHFLVATNEGTLEIPFFGHHWASVLEVDSGCCCGSVNLANGNYQS